MSLQDPFQTFWLLAAACLVVGFRMHLTVHTVDIDSPEQSALSSIECAPLIVASSRNLFTCWHLSFCNQISACLAQAFKQYILSCAGTLPSMWAQVGAFPTLKVLYLGDLPLQGSLPPAWGTPGCFPSLEKLYLWSSDIGVGNISGTLPAEWGSSTAYQSLEYMQIVNLSITGGFAILACMAMSCMTLPSMHTCKAYDQIDDTLCVYMMWTLKPCLSLPYLSSDSNILCCMLCSAYYRLVVECMPLG